jgi:hypothetical protein
MSKNISAFSGAPVRTYFSSLQMLLVSNFAPAKTLSSLVFSVNTFSSTRGSIFLLRASILWRIA